nr:MAG TPA: hypothetical protein [Caudoviricetes sp.]
MINFKLEKIHPYRKEGRNIEKIFILTEIFEVILYLKSDINKIKSSISITAKKKRLMYLEIVEKNFVEIIKKYNELCVEKDKYELYEEDSEVFSLNTRLSRAISFFHRLSTGKPMSINTLIRTTKANLDTPFDYAKSMVKYLEVMVNTISTIPENHFKS